MLWNKTGIIEIRRGKNREMFVFVPLLRIKGNCKLVIGNNTWIGHNCLIVCSANIMIGSDVDIAPMCYIGTGSHEITPYSDKIAGNGYSLPIRISNGC